MSSRPLMFEADYLLVPVIVQATRSVNRRNGMVKLCLGVVAYFDTYRITYRRWACRGSLAID